MVRFIDSGGSVTYARAHDVSTRSIAPGQSGTVLVDIPSFYYLPPGRYSVQVVVMGIQSDPVFVVIGDPCAEIRAQLDALSPGDFQSLKAYLRALRYFEAQLKACERE